MQTAKDHAAGIQKRNFMSAGVVLLLEVQFHAANENLKVFGNFLLLWLRGSCLQFCKHRFCLTALLVFIGQRGLGDLVVILAEPFPRALLGMVLHLHSQQFVGVPVADCDPAGRGGLREDETAQKDNVNQKQIDSFRQRKTPLNQGA